MYRRSVALCQVNFSSMSRECRVFPTIISTMWKIIAICIRISRPDYQKYSLWREYEGERSADELLSPRKVFDRIRDFKCIFEKNIR